MTKSFVAYRLVIGNNQWLINWLPIDYLLITHWFHWCHWCHRLVMFGKINPNPASDKSTVSHSRLTMSNSSCIVQQWLRNLDEHAKCTFEMFVANLCQSLQCHIRCHLQTDWLTANEKNKSAERSVCNNLTSVFNVKTSYKDVHFFALVV